MSGTTSALVASGLLIMKQKMKAKYHLPTEQYGFLEVEIDFGIPPVTQKEIMEETAKVYKDLKDAWSKINISKVEQKMRKKEIADPLNHIDVTINE